MQAVDILKNAVRILDEKRGKDITALRIAELSPMADYFLLATGNSLTHIRSLAEELEEGLSRLGREPRAVEGRATGWILLDYGDVVVHVFTRESRECFKLEKLWADAPETDLSGWLSQPHTAEKF